MIPLRIFVGWDGREPLAYHVFCHSILRRSSIPVAITPLVQGMLARQQMYTRERHSSESTEFSLTRFLVPHLAGYEGIALFADCDMLMLADIATLPVTVMHRGGDLVAQPLGDIVQYSTAFDLARSPVAWACQHEYVPRTETKMDGIQQTAYPKKNWSSFMLFNAARCQNVTPAYVNRATPKELHRFEWASDVGAIPLEWNWLVGEYDAPPTPPKNLHYTLGGPWFAGQERCDFAETWYNERDNMLGV